MAGVGRRDKGHLYYRQGWEGDGICDENGPGRKEKGITTVSKSANEVMRPPVQVDSK